MRKHTKVECSFIVAGKRISWVKSARPEKVEDKKHCSNVGLKSSLGIFALSWSQWEEAIKEFETMVL